jgi:thioester reductase-like protein
MHVLVTGGSGYLGQFLVRCTRGCRRRAVAAPPLALTRRGAAG